MEWSAKTSKKRRKQTEEKHWKVKRKKNEEYEESQITTIYIFGFKLYFSRNHNLKVHTIKFYLQFLCVAGYLKHCNDTPNLNIHKYKNYNIIEIYINRLSTTTQIFIVMDYLIMISEKYLYFRKKNKNIWQGHFFTYPIEVTGSMYFKHVFWIMCLPKICTKAFKKL